MPELFKPAVLECKHYFFFISNHLPHPRALAARSARTGARRRRGRPAAGQAGHGGGVCERRSVRVRGRQCGQRARRRRARAPALARQHGGAGAARGPDGARHVGGRLARLHVARLDELTRRHITSTTPDYFTPNSFIMRHRVQSLEILATNNSYFSIVIFK